ncbi:MAG: hypothetical protein JWP69_1336 [Flaviaesturariibacter sp.]|nr:hypothetical protein [Flaviaesturariibacter sp.]
MVPFRGKKINTDALQSFIRSYFAGPKPIWQIEISDIVEYTDVKKWITTVRNWESFQSLNKMIGFAGDVLHKYFPDEIDVK